MGGRGARSSQGRFGLPNGARAVTVTFSSGARKTYFDNKGMLMEADRVGSTSGTPVKSSRPVSIGDIYKRAVEKGYDVELLSPEQVARGNAEVGARREANLRAVTYAENHPSKQAKRISRHSGRIKAKRR